MAQTALEMPCPQTGSEHLPCTRFELKNDFLSEQQRLEDEQQHLSLCSEPRAGTLHQQQAS